MLAGSVNFDGWGLRTYPLQYTQLTELTMNSNRLERVRCIGAHCRALRSAAALSAAGL